MATVATLTSADLSVAVNDHGFPTGITSLSDMVNNLTSGYILKVVWGYEDSDSVITYPGTGVLVDSGADYATVEITGHGDGLGNEITISGTVTLSSDTIDVETSVTLTAVGSVTPTSIGLTNHLEVVLAGTAYEAGETIFGISTEKATSGLGVYPDNISGDYYRDQTAGVYLGIRQDSRWIGMMGAACISVSAEARDITSVWVYFDPLPTAPALNEVRLIHARIIVRDENLTVSAIRTQMASEMLAWLGAIPGVIPDAVVNSYRLIQPARMLVGSVGVYTPRTDADYLAANYVQARDSILLWAARRRYYAHPEYTDPTVRALAYDPLTEQLAAVRSAGASQIILRLYPVDQYFVDNPAKSVYYANGESALGYYQVPDGYPALYLMAQPDHADMQVYWDNFTEIARNYDFDMASIEEFYYQDISYGPNDEAHYIQWIFDTYDEVVGGFEWVDCPAWYSRGGRASDGKIVKYWATRIMAWRNYCMRQFYTRCKEILATYGKRLAVELRCAYTAGYYPNEIEAAQDASPGAVIDVGWRGVAHFNAYDYSLVPDGIVDTFVLWFYWDIWATDLGGGSYEITLDPATFMQEMVTFYRTELALRPDQLHFHLGPAYHSAPVEWYSYGLSRWETGMQLLNRYLGPYGSVSCELGTLPGIHATQSSTSPVSVTDEAVVRSADDNDALAYWKDVAITSVGDTPGATDYINGTDYEFSGNRLYWIGSAPAAGATYYVTYTAAAYSEAYAQATASTEKQVYIDDWLNFIDGFDTRAALTIQQITRSGSGLAAIYPAPDIVLLFIPNNDGRMFLDVQNDGDVTQTVTVSVINHGLDIPDYVATISPDSGERLIGPFPPAVFSQADGSVYIDLSAVTTVSIACLRL